MTDNPLDIFNIINKRTVENFRSSFSNITGMLMAFSDIEKKYNTISLHSKCAFCKLLNHNNENSPCLFSTGKKNIIDSSRKKYYIYKCKAGLYEAVFPIVVAGKHIGNIFSGQVMVTPPTDEKFDRIKDTLLKAGLLNKTIKKAYLDIPVIRTYKFKLSCSLLSAFIDYIIETEINEKYKLNKTQPVEYHKNELIIEKAKEYIQNNYKRHIHINEVANEVHLSPSYFASLFKKEMKLSYINYLTLVRMENAKKLLANSDKPIKVISEEVGYSDPNYFSNAFLKEVGVRPNLYRK